MTRNEKSGAAALPAPPVTGTSADMLFRKAGPGDCARAQEIIRLARERMGRQGNPQWQDGYPADEDVRHDIEAGNGYVLCLHNRPVVYGAILFDEEPAYGPIEGRWLNDRPYAVVHRLAVHEAFERKGLAGLFLQQAERLCLDRHLFDIRADTHSANGPMRSLLERSGYVFCGEIRYRKSPRRAYQKSSAKARKKAAERTFPPLLRNGQVPTLSGARIAMLVSEKAHSIHTVFSCSCR